GTATVDAGSRTVTFGGGAVLPADVGAGDRLTVSGEQFYLLSRVSDTEVRVQEIPCTDYVDQAYTIERAYNTMQAWEDDRQGDLVAETRQEVGVVYNDGSFGDRLTISGSTTDASYYMRLTVADGQGHSGLKDTGAVIDAAGGWGGLHAITVEDEYTRIEGLEIKAIQDAGSAIHLSASPPADNSVVDGIFVHACWQNGNAGVAIGATPGTVRNSFFTGGTSWGIQVLASATGIIESCTIVGAPISGTGVGDSVLSTTSISNTISVNHPTDRNFVLWSNISSCSGPTSRSSGTTCTPAPWGSIRARTTGATSRPRAAWSRCSWTSPPTISTSKPAGTRRGAMVWIYRAASRATSTAPPG
ncbi:MAG: right-handed parallel beta-helix repeat-containing protein, partial [Planctomycetota bacterium]